MAFVNEFALKDDLERYGITELHKSGRVPEWQDAWTIDREREVVLMHVASGHELDTMNFHQFMISRNGQVSYFWLAQDFDSNNRSIIWTLERFREPDYISEEERLRFESLYIDLKDALRTYKGAGCYHTETNTYENVVFRNF